MPETRSERIIFGIGILAIAALVAVIVLEITTDRFKGHATPAALPPMTATTTTEAAAPPSAPTIGETGPAPERARASATGVRLTLRATADTWVEVRARSPDGDVLYVGILPEGTVKRFSWYANVGAIRCCLEPHGPTERNAPAPAAGHL